MGAGGKCLLHEALAAFLAGPHEVGIVCAIKTLPPMARRPISAKLTSRLALIGFAALLVACEAKEKAAEDVGFYYAANALGRFFGTLMSGLLYQWGGLMWTLAGSALMLAACWLITLRLPVHAAPSPAVSRAGT